MSQASFNIGDLVRVLKVPPQVEREMPPETRELFRKTVGNVFKVDSFGEYGHLELNVQNDGTQAPDYCHHTIWIESEFVELAERN